MTRQSKQGERRARSPRKHKNPSSKTGAKKDNLPAGFKSHDNAYAGEGNIFIPKVR
ncbi:MAG: hypothetical protein K940chlam9_00862 [Chlamydiae bacterium]|nr:hypothetical protein [Chlamydiota bacterium]